MINELKIGIIVADEDEYKPFYNKILTGEFEAVIEYSFLGRTGHTFKINSESYVIEIVSILCGIGKVNAAAATAHLVDIGCQVVLNFGLSGGISGVRRGDICICDKYLEHDFDLTGIGYKPCEKPTQKYIYNADKRLINMVNSLGNDFKTGTAVSGDHFVCDEAQRDFLKLTFNATSCDMETAAIAYVCEFSGTPFVAVRKISDDAGAEAVDSYRDMNSQNDENLVEIIFELIKEIVKSTEFIETL